MRNRNGLHAEMEEMKSHLHCFNGRGEFRKLGFRSLSYTGCWTCRKRRTKCDERPGACRKCEEANLVCGGYEIRLNWNAGRSRRSSKTGGGRRQIRPDRPACKVMTDDEVARCLSRVDRVAGEPETPTGPFSVFRVQPIQSTRNVRADATHDGKSRDLHEIDEHVEENSQNPCSSDVLTAICQPFVPNGAFEAIDLPLDRSLTLSSGGKGSISCVSSKGADDAEEDPSESSIGGPGTELSEYLLRHDADAISKGTMTYRHMGSVSSSQRVYYPALEEDAANQELAPSSSSPPSHLPPRGRQPVVTNTALISLYRDFSPLIFGNRSATRLIHHYTNHLVHRMQPVLHRENPFQRLYLPLAIEGSSDLGVTSDLDRASLARVAVFHSLLCTAALHLHGLGSGEEGLQQLACHHKQRALVALRNALGGKLSKYKDLTIAMLSLVSADIIDGGTSDHWIHLEAAIQLQASRHHAHLVSRETGQLNMICVMLRLFAQTALPVAEPTPWVTEESIPDYTDHHYGNSSIEYLYGITATIARSIDRIYRITKSLAYYKSGGYSAVLLEACETLIDDLHSWTISSEPFSSIVMEQEDTILIARAQTRAFHYASLIYYYRSVQNCDRQCLQLEQQATLAAMNEAEDLKLVSSNASDQPAPITWPAFIASCEAVGEFRMEWDRWWDRLQTYRMKNFSKQQSIVHRIWTELDRSSNTRLDWREVLAALGIRIIPV